MREKVKKSLTDLISAIQAARIYTKEHPKFNDFIDRVFNSLEDILKERSELVIGIVDGVLAVEKEVFFDLSKKLKPLISFLEGKDIERIIFQRNFQREELVKFVSFLTAGKEEREKDIQEHLSFLGIKNIRAGKIKAPSSTLKEEKKPKSVSEEYEDSIDIISQFLKTAMDGQELDNMELKFYLANFMGSLMGRYQEFLNVTSGKKKDIILFIHTLNVSILSMYISSKVGFSEDDVLDIGTAALFHDIGSVYVSQKRVPDKDKQEKEEPSQKKHHTILGAEILLKYIDTFGVLPVVVAFEHHLRYDLKGHPSVSFPRRPHPASLIVSMCDVYDALAQRQIHKKTYSPLDIYNIMMKEKGGLFDPQLLEKFFRIMGVWPIGTIVSLSDGKIAVVREQNEDDVFHPKVEVISPEEKRGFIDLAEEKEEIEIDRSLDSSEEREKYLHLIGSEQ